MIHPEGTDIIEVAILPRASVDVQPYTHVITLMDIELLYLVSAKHPEETSAWILVFGLNDKLLRLPRVASTTGNALFGRVFLDDNPLYFYSL